MKKSMKVVAVFLSALMLTSMAGCQSSKQKAEQASKAAVSQPLYITKPAVATMNDYRGASFRATIIRDLVVGTMNEMKQQNTTIRTNAPNSYWNDDSYQDFVSTLMNIPIVNDCIYFTEEECDWNTVLTAMSQATSSFTTTEGEVSALSSGEKKTTAFKKGISVVRNNKDDYTVSGITASLDGINLLKTIAGSTKKKVTYSGDATWRALYDCDKDWAKAYCQVTFKDASLPQVTAQMFEYMRLDENTFVIQTSTERLYVVLQPVEADTPLNQRKVKEFYYSKLIRDGARSSFKSFSPMSTYDPKTGKYNKEAQKYNDLMQQYYLLNEKGDVANMYGIRDSVLTRDDRSTLTRDWVFEETTLEQAIVYKDEAFVATTYNKLSEKYDQFSYFLTTTPEELQNEMLNIVDINALVGILAVPETDLSLTEPVNPYNTFTLEDMEGLGLTYDEDNNVVDEAGKVIISVWDGKTYPSAAEAKQAMMDAKTRPVETTEEEETSEENPEETSEGETTEETAESEAAAT